MDKRLERILPRVQKPARYVGGEFNAIMKDKSKRRKEFSCKGCMLASTCGGACDRKEADE